jgi:endogenous inhibitor of DNA gyrase (YacG/DUF329 family)
MSDSTLRTVPCPTCRRPAVFDPSNRWRPFCGERCRSADLGAWASESFRLPADASDEAPPDASPADAHLPPGH